MALQCIEIFNLKYAYAIHINDLYGSVLSSDYAGFPTGNFNPESKFYNFLPNLSRKENLQLYDLFDDAYEDKELLNKVNLVELLVQNWNLLVPYIKQLKYIN